MWITVWNAATLNWILCQLWLSTINTINNRKDRLHARKTGCNHSACVAHRPHPPPFPLRVYISKQASVCTAQPLALLPLYLALFLCPSPSLASIVHLPRKFLALKSYDNCARCRLRRRDVDCSASTDCAHSPLASVYVFLQPAATSIYEKLLSSRGQMKWVDIAIDVGFNVVSVCLLLLLRQRRQQKKQEEQLVVHSFLFFFHRVSHRVLMFFYSSFCFVLQSSSVARYSNLFHFHWHWFLFFLSFLLLFGVILDNCHTGSVRVSSFFLFFKRLDSNVATSFLINRIRLY